MPDPGTEYIRYLQEAGCDPRVIAHCQAVRDVALQITEHILHAGICTVDQNLVAAGAILHDIGRSVSHGMDHADIGGSICRELNFSPAIIQIVERHIGAGLSAREREELGLSAVDRIPVTVEEKIVAHADNLVKGVRVISRHDLEQSVLKFPPDVRSRFIALADELEHLAGDRDLP